MSFLLDPPFPPRLPLEAAASDSFEQQASAVAKLHMATEASFELEVSVDNKRLAKIVCMHYAPLCMALPLSMLV